LANIFLDMLQRKGSREISLLSLIWGVLTFSDNKTINDEVFQETTEYEKGFAKYYQENLKPKISELEEERLNALRTAAQKIRPLIIVFISILISFLFVWFILGDLLDVFYIEDFLPFYYEITELSDGNSIFYFAIVFLIYVSLLYFFTLPTLRSVRNLKSSSKSEIFSVILKFFGDFTFTAKPNISVSQFESTGLIPKYKREENEDYIIGDYEGVKVELFESILSLTEKNTDLLKTKEDNKFVTTITFQGLFVKFQMNKNFNGKTVVSDGTAKTKGLKEVILEDPEFKNIWDVHSDDQVEAMTLADRMIVMNEGNVEHIGTPLEVYTKPKTLFTAQFIGSPAMNILKGNCGGNKLILANKASLSVNSKFNGAVNIGMRPEDFELDQNGPIKLKVELVELIGANTLIHGKLENSNEILVASISGVVKEDTIGKNINLSIQNDKLHLFDTNTD